MTPRLAPDTLHHVTAGVGTPAYARAELSIGIVHLGLGAFARAHLAAATEAALAAGGARHWGLCGASLRHADTHDALAPQRGLYTLVERDADPQGRPRQRLQVIGCLRELLVAPRDTSVLLERIATPSTRIVSLTVTEKGYVTGPGGALDVLLQGLSLRRERHEPGLTLLSLDNLASNGDTLHRRLVETARARGDDVLADWLSRRCTFPNSMVDRIVPRTTDADREAVTAALGLRDDWPVLAEPYFDWAVEDRFACGRPDWAMPGVRLVDDAAPWERLKLRMVNGAHSAIAYLGVQAGWATVHEAMSQPALRAYVERLLGDEIAPTLPPLPGLDTAAYTAALLGRFANPALAHRTLQIAMDGTQKLPLRWLPVLRERLAAGASSPGLALALAGWIQHQRGTDEAGRRHVIDDPLSAALDAHAAAAPPDAAAAARHWLSFQPVFGDLGRHPVLAADVAAALARLRALGVAAALAPG